MPAVVAVLIAAFLLASPVVDEVVSSRGRGIATAAAQTPAETTPTIPPVLQALTGGEVKCGDGKAGIYDCQNIDLLAFLPGKVLGVKYPASPLRLFGGRDSGLVNNTWGWIDSTTGREFALVGRPDGVAFVEVTDPVNPKYLGELLPPEGAGRSGVHDVKVYKNHAFIVAEPEGQKSNPHGMQIFDLTQLRNVKAAPVTFQATAHYDGFDMAHTLALNEETGYAYPVFARGAGASCNQLLMIDVRVPTKPVSAGCFVEPTLGDAHETVCVVYRGLDQQYKGREICVTSNVKAVVVTDVTDKTQPKTISIFTYPNVSYAHQGWFSEDQRYFFLDDELDTRVGGINSTRTIVFDMTDLDDPVVATQFYGTTPATDHNLYVRGRYMYQSNYSAGLRVIDVADPKNPKEVGYFDTYPGHDKPGFSGAWGSYPYFKNGVVAVTSMGEGLFILRFRP